MKRFNSGTPTPPELSPLFRHAGASYSYTGETTVSGVCSLRCPIGLSRKISSIFDLFCFDRRRIAQHLPAKVVGVDNDGSLEMAGIFLRQGFPEVLVPVFDLYCLLLGYPFQYP